MTATSSPDTTSSQPANDRQRTEVNGIVRSMEDNTFDDLVWRIDEFLKVDTMEKVGKEGKVRRGTQEKVRESLGVISKALEDYTFEALALSFNGGKDCLVLLLLYIYILHTQSSTSRIPNNVSHISTSSTQRRKIPTCFVTPPQTFPEVDTFVTECSARYNLDVERISLPMKPAFTQYLQNHPDVKAVLVGTRRTDPHGEFLTHFDRTDHGWPEFMRVHPVIDWHYWEIWDFLRALRVPYCILYDRGFTSLGGTLDTHPNPSLKTAEGRGFMPAYELLDESKERCGRD